MTYKVESSLWDFPAWAGGKDTLDTLKEKDDVEAVEDWWNAQEEKTKVEIYKKETE